MGLDGVDHGPAHDIHEEQGKREAKAHKDSEQNGSGWAGLSRGEGYHQTIFQRVRCMSQSGM